MTTFYPKPPVPLANFRSAVKKLSPPWLAGNNGYRFQYSIAIQLDAVAEYFRIGSLQRFPAYCEAEALQHLGKDRRLWRGPTETEEGYRARLLVWLSTWKYAGHPKAVLGQLAAYHAPNPPVMRYVSNGYDEAGNTVSDWWTLSGGVYSYHRATPANWNWDGTFGNFRFWIILYKPLLPTWNWNDGNRWNDPGLLWGYKNGQAIADIRNLIGIWKCAGSHCHKIIYASNTTRRFVRWGEFNWGGGTTWGQSTTVAMFDPAAAPGQPMPDGTWGDYHNWNPDAQYFSGI